MRPPIVSIAVVALSLSSVAHAQTRAECRTLAQNASSILSPAIVNLKRIESMDQHISALRSASSGELRVSLDEFDEARRNLASVWREFIRATRDLRDRAEACGSSARRRGRR